MMRKRKTEEAEVIEGGWGWGRNGKLEEGDEEEGETHRKVRCWWVVGGRKEGDDGKGGLATAGAEKRNVMCGWVAIPLHLARSPFHHPLPSTWTPGNPEPLD